MNSGERVSRGGEPVERAVIALGSNLGRRARELERAVDAIDGLRGVRVVARSSWHETDPVGGPAGQPRFMNGVVVVDSELDPRRLLRALQRIEAARGRDREREERNGPRTLDLDLLFHGGQCIREPELELPHPRLEARVFVLAPLAELEPDRVLAGCGRTVRERLRELRGEQQAAE